MLKNPNKKLKSHLFFFWFGDEQILIQTEIKSEAYTNMFIETQTTRKHPLKVCTWNEGNTINISVQITIGFANCNKINK